MSNKQYILRKPVTKKDFVYDGYKLPYYTIEALKSIDFSTIHPDNFKSYLSSLMKIYYANKSEVK